MHFPGWFGNGFYEAPAAEKRSHKGWDKLEVGTPNEAFDLLCYVKAAAVKLGAEKSDWNSSAGRARDWSENSWVDVTVAPQPEPPEVRRVHVGFGPTVGLGCRDWVLSVRPMFPRKQGAGQGKTGREAVAAERDEAFLQVLRDAAHSISDSHRLTEAQATELADTLTRYIQERFGGERGERGERVYVHAMNRRALK